MNTENSMTMEIDGITYVVSTHHFSCEETVIDKITRLVREDATLVEILDI